MLFQWNLFFKRKCQTMFRGDIPFLKIIVSKMYPFWSKRVKSGFLLKKYICKGWEISHKSFVIVSSLYLFFLKACAHLRIHIHAHRDTHTQAHTHFFHNIGKTGFQIENLEHPRYKRQQNKMFWALGN
jgi:hypothetical protein